MGLVSGFTGGVTLTLGVAYLSVLAHERNRNSQALYLRSQSQLLNSIHDLEPQTLPLSRAEIARTSRSNFTETAKDRWNEEVENAVRRVQTTDWNNVREGLEGAIARLLGKGLEHSRDGIEEAEGIAGLKVQEALNVSKTSARRIADGAIDSTKVGADQIVGKMRNVVDNIDGKRHDLASAAKGRAAQLSTDVKSGAGRAADLGQASWDQEVERSQELMERTKDRLSHQSGTVDAAREVVRDVFSNGIEKGQELFGRAQAAMGLAVEKIDSSVAERMEGMSVVDKAFEARYERLHGLDKTVEQALEERYKSIEQKF